MKHSNRTLLRAKVAGQMEKRSDSWRGTILRSSK